MNENKKLKILVIENNQLDRYAAISQLGAGHDVTVTKSYEEALWIGEEPNGWTWTACDVVNKYDVVLIGTVSREELPYAIREREGGKPCIELGEEVPAGILGSLAHHRNMRLRWLGVMSKTSRTLRVDLPNRRLCWAAMPIGTRAAVFEAHPGSEESRRVKDWRALLDHLLSA